MGVALPVAAPPSGRVRSIKTDANFTTTSTTGADVGPAVTFTVAAGETWEVKYDADSFTCTNSGASCILQARDVGNTIHSQIRGIMAAANGRQPVGARCFDITTPGTYTIRLVALTSAGTLTIPAAVGNSIALDARRVA